MLNFFATQNQPTKTLTKQTCLQKGIALHSIPQDPDVSKKTTANTSTRASNARETTQTTGTATLETIPGQHFQQLPTPIKIKPLETYLDGCPNKEYIVSGFQNGFSLHFDGVQQRLTSENSISANHKPEIIEQSIQHELTLNRISGPHNNPPLPNFKSSPISLREKKDSGKFRMLHNLSYPYNDSSVNENIPREFATISYPSIKDAINAIHQCQPLPYMAKSDISEAYRLVPVSPEDYNLLGFSWNGNYYYDKCLPQGCRSSCQIFQKISNALLWILKNKFGFENIVNVLDDFLFIAHSYDKCLTMLNSFKLLAEELGIPLAEKKTVGPTTNLIFLGIQLDSANKIASLPLEKINTYSQDLATIQSHKKVTLRELRSCIGKLQFATSVIRPGRPFLRRLINRTIGIKKPHHFIRLRSEELRDIEIWQDFLKSYNGITILRPPSFVNSETINFYTDSSHMGFGGTYGTQLIQEYFPESWKNYHISILEIYPIYVLIKMFAQKILNADIVFHCDNEAVVNVLNKQTSKDPYLLKIIRLIVLEQLKYNFTLSSKHIPGVTNILADKISRFQVTSLLLRRYGMRETKTSIPLSLLPINFNFNSQKY